MSILIKGVTASTCCAACQFAEEESPEWFTCYAQDCSLPMANRYVVDSNCPLVELPEHHGRLVDADYLEKHAGEWLSTYNLIDSAETIIDAE